MKQKQSLRMFLTQVVKSFPKLMIAYRNVRYVWQVHEEPKETPMGFKLIGNYNMENGQFELEEKQIVTQILPFVDIFINIGANIGYYSCIALSQGKYVVAFEPENLNLKYLLRNIKANNWGSRIEVYPMALGNKVNLIEFYGGGTTASIVKGWAGTPETYVTLVPSTTLDNVLGERFRGKQCFVLVDIEGAEQLMLDGASLMINLTPKPIWMVEISISEHQDKGININPNINPNLLSTFRVFWNNGYEAWTADKQCRIIHPDEIEQIVRSGINTLYIHNFLFIEKGKKHEFFDMPKN